MGSGGSDPSNPQVLLIHNVEDGIKRFGNASKEYVAAVRAVSASLEHLAVAMRQLSLGDIPPELHARIDRFGTVVGLHQSAAATNNNNNRKGSVGNESNNDMNSVNHRNSASKVSVQLDYPLAPYINDFSKDVGSATDDLKMLTKMARKKQEEYESAAKKYNETRLEVEKIEKSDVKKNRNSADNPKYTKKIEKREKQRVEAEQKAQELNKACQALITRRAEVMTRVMDAMGSQTFRYWNGIAHLMQDGSMGGSRSNSVV
ncbi:uncharacterized protein TM35_000131740 [Trypanosoma theileri]|uniref:BAR domain-containing protein n=1 Tax=Trypanosoma theileri TaxID=67003 RepID=A0A1X0NYD1_9TRYP|nr:uncharacterized protein TM35_000131740 [Trypanosoma theileri]ORC89170.1 hypothetical protein TM35_000131740 [Trypanosoma theileri]